MHRLCCKGAAMLEQINLQESVRGWGLGVGGVGQVRQGDAQDS
jgi:hypothetical protein